KPDIVHLNDYQTALVAAYLRRLYVEEPRLAKPALVYSIHNLAYQGVFAADRLTTMGFEPALCEHPSPFEFHGNVNLMKIGIDLADVVNTVSPRYAEEIRGAEQGAGLEGLLDASADKLFGILNGIDTTIWDPATDPELPYAFHVDRMSGKRGCKAALLSEAGISLDRLDRPLFGMVGRLVAQKGVDLVLQVADELVGRDVGLIVLGSGASDLEEGLRALAARHPDRVGVRIGFDNGLAHRITAGADFFLMPSRYEPCGLNQMYAMRYGTIPIVKRTGGLADTVQHWNPVTHEGTGFLFDESEAVSMARAILSALEAYRDRAGWDQLRRNAMAQDFSWDRSAKDYINLYDEALCRHREP
ncbi:MAG: glycogen synthase, partial [Planctomycetes bacterium]|nr:glycogen synthase [Planctomycetota bacterium]